MELSQNDFTALVYHENGGNSPMYESLNKVLHKLSNGRSQYKLVYTNQISEIENHPEIEKIKFVVFEKSAKSSEEESLKKFRNIKDKFQTTPIVVACPAKASHFAMQALKEGTQEFVPIEDLSEEMLTDAINYAQRRGDLINAIKMIDSNPESKLRAFSYYLDQIQKDLEIHTKVISKQLNQLTIRDKVADKDLVDIERSVESLRFYAQTAVSIPGISDLDTTKTSLRIHLPTLLQNISDVVANHFETQRAEYIHRISDDVPQTVWGDPSRLSQVILQLVGFALKKAQYGGVMLHVEPMSVSTKEVSLRFIVAHSLLKDEDHLNILDMTNPSDGSLIPNNTELYSHLSLANRIVQEIGGRIWVRSKAGQGSVLSFSAAFQLQPSSVVSEDFIGPIKVLVIDDNPVNLALFKRTLEKGGFEVTAAKSAIEGLEILERTSFDAVLTDYCMPEMNGADATRELHTREKKKNKKKLTPVIGATASPTADVQKDCLSSGIEVLLTKPVDKDILLKAIKSAVQRSRSRN